MKKKLILHIGPHKTGSTFIQKSLVKNEAKLKEASFLYPKKRREFSHGHHALAKAFQENDKIFIDSFLSEMERSSEDVIISSEDFDRLTSDQVRVLKEVLVSYDVTVVYFKRRFDSLLFSNLQEDIKQGGCKTYVEFLFSHLLNPLSSKILNHRIVLDSYSECFGKDNVIIFDYDQIVNSGANLFIAFMDGLQISIDKLAINNKKFNESLSLEIVEILRTLNCIARRNEILQGTNIRKIFFKMKPHKRRDVAELAHIIKRYIVSYELDCENIEDLLEREFSQKYVAVNSENGDHQTRSPLIINMPRTEWLIEEKAVEIVRGIYNEIEDIIEKGAGAEKKKRFGFWPSLKFNKKAD